MKTPVRTDKAPAPFQGAPYSQGIVFGDLVFVAGQLGIDPASGEVVKGGIAEQTERAMQNLAAILEEAGSGLGLNAFRQRFPPSGATAAASVRSGG